MKRQFKRTLFISCCLAALLFAIGTTPKSSAAALAPSKSLAGGGSCNQSDPQNTGISYDANTYITTITDDSLTPQPMGMFSNAGSDAPAIGGSGCMNDNGIRLDVGNVGAAWYNVQITVNGVTTQTTPPSNQVFTYGDHMLILLPLQADQQSAFQVQSCSDTCSAWSPTLSFTGAANSYCQDGYVWREATPFDHVCVTPDQYSQAASDNSQAASRVDPSGAYGPQSCISGYVWREAFGGDYVCVTLTPDERSQVAYDNSQAIARIVAL